MQTEEGQKREGNREIQTEKENKREGRQVDGAREGEEEGI